MLFGTESAELLMLDKIQEIFGCGFMDFIMPCITALGNAGVIWIVICVLMLLSKKHRKTGMALAMALILVLVIGNLILKPMIARPRPFTLNTVELLIAVPTDFSFPSGHTYASFVSAFVLLKHIRKAGVGALVLAALIAFSRLYLYVHYPTDVLFGIAVAALVYYVVRLIEGRAYADE